MRRHSSKRKSTAIRLMTRFTNFHNTKNSVNDPVAVTMKNAGPNVNSAYTELSPYPLGDTALLFSTMSQNSVVEVNKRKRSDYTARFMTSHKQYHVSDVDSFEWPLPFN